MQISYQWGQNILYKLCVDTIAIGVDTALEKKD